MSGSDHDELLTLEPLMEAVRAGVEGAGWALSGLQKTTSHQFEGRWEGESTRSAYLFFHTPAAPDFVSIDVYLDETSRGLTGNLALVVDLVSLAELGDATSALKNLGSLSVRALDGDSRRPLTLRLRLDDAATEVGEAEAEVRFKVRIPRRAIDQGTPAVRVLAERAVGAFETILESPDLRAFTDGS